MATLKTKVPKSLKTFYLEKQITGKLAIDVNKRSSIDQTPCPITATVLSGAELYNYVPVKGDWGWTYEYTRFVFDLATLKYNEKSVIDWNHDANEVIGGCESIKLENGALVAKGKLVPFRTGDRAAEVAYKSQMIPFGISPTVTFDSAVRIDVPSGESVKLNSRIYHGPIAVFTGAEILGISVCPYPTDGQTSVDTLKKKYFRQVAKNVTKERLIQMARGKFDETTADAAVEEVIDAVIEEVLAEVSDEAQLDETINEVEDRQTDEAQLEDTIIDDEKKEEKSSLRKLLRSLFSDGVSKKDEAQLEDETVAEEEKKEEAKKEGESAAASALKRRISARLAKQARFSRVSGTSENNELKGSIEELAKIVARLAAVQLAGGETSPLSSTGSAKANYAKATEMALRKLLK